jgi:hypothetical protein
MNVGVLVLNSDYSPINVTSFKRGFNLVFKGKAEVVQSTGEPITTSLGEFLRPIIIRLLDYIHYRPKKISDIISHDQNIETIKKLLLNKALPHLLF